MAAAHPLPTRWQRGDIITQEEYWRGQLITVRPQLVVEDSERMLALFSPHGSPFLFAGMANRGQLPMAERLHIYLSDEPPPLRARRTRANVLTLTPPGAAHSTWLFWDTTWVLTDWYVNLQTPLDRFPGGVRYRDQLLDLHLTPALDWAWKDEDEFEEVCAAGVFDAAERERIRAEGEAVIALIEARAWPFTPEWTQWRPDPSWPALELPVGWTPPLSA